MKFEKKDKSHLLLKGAFCADYIWTAVITLVNRDSVL